MIQSCSFKDGKSVDDLQANDKIWNKYLDDSGFEGGYWRWWPETGSPTETDYDYLVAVSFSSVEEYGAQPPIELLRLFLDKKGLYEREVYLWVPQQRQDYIFF